VHASMKAQPCIGGGAACRAGGHAFRAADFELVTGQQAAGKQDKKQQGRGHPLAGRQEAGLKPGAGAAAGPAGGAAWEVARRRGSSRP
jgi:hypothetical protein